MGAVCLLKRARLRARECVNSEGRPSISNGEVVPVGACRMRALKSAVRGAHKNLFLTSQSTMSKGFLAAAVINKKIIVVRVNGKIIGKNKR